MVLSIIYQLIIKAPLIVNWGLV